MRRLVGLLLLASGCQCTFPSRYKPLSKSCGPGSAVACPTEADAIAAGLRSAEKRLLDEGSCSGGGSMVGTSTFGTWVSPEARVPICGDELYSFCEEELHFDHSGTLIGKRECCCGRCSDFGLSPLIRRWRLTRELCAEARRGLVVRGVRLPRTAADSLRASDGGSVPRVGLYWLLPFGTWTATLPADAGEFTFSFTDDRDGGTLISGSPTRWLEHFPRRDGRPGAPVELPVWFELADGGTRPIAVTPDSNGY